MSELIFALPVSVEQIAIVIKQMSLDDQKRLLDLVPTLHQVANHPLIRPEKQTQENISRLQAEVLTAVNNRPLAAHDPFLAGLTLDEYYALPDQEKSKLWDDLTDDNLMALEEQEVSPNALLAG